MITKLIEKLKMEKTEIQSFNFKEKCTGVAGICPDCGGIVSFNSYHGRYECKHIECCFMANEKGKRIWDNNMRRKYIEKLSQKNSIIID